LREIACNNPRGVSKRLSTGVAAFKHNSDVSNFAGAAFAAVNPKKLAKNENKKFLRAHMV